MLGLSFSSKLDWDFYTIFIVKITFKKIGPLIFSMKFFLLKLLFIFINLAYSLANITLVMCGQVLQIAQKSIEKRMQDYWSHNCSLSGTLNLSSNCSQPKCFLQVLNVLLNRPNWFHFLALVTRMSISTVPFLAQD